MLSLRSLLTLATIERVLVVNYYGVLVNSKINDFELLNTYQSYAFTFMQDLGCLRIS